MKALKTTLLSTLAGLALLLSTPPAQAINCPAGAACTDPVGFITLTANPSDDGVVKKITLLGLGLFNAVEFQGPVDTVNGSILGVGGIQASQFDGFYFVQIASGANSGIMMDIVSTSTDAITVDQDISAFITAGDIIKIRKHHTVASVFGANNEFGLLGGSDVKTIDTIQLFSSNGGSKTIFYFPDFNVWTDGLDDFGDFIIYPDQGIVIRRIGTSTGVSTKLLGSVKTDTTGITIESGFNLISNVFPVDTTIGESGLNTNDGGTTGFSEGNDPKTTDTIRIFDSQGILKTYFLFDAANNVWTDGLNATNDIVIETGSSFVIDRKGSSFNWLQAPPF